MYSTMKDWRKNNINMYDPRHYCFENYHTDVSKKEMKHSFGEELLTNLHLLPDPLKKNLADSIITPDDQYKQKKCDKNVLNMAAMETELPKMDKAQNRSDATSIPTFAGITNFFSGVLNVIQGAMFQWRPKSPAQYYDCFDDSNVSQQGSPPIWQPSNVEFQNKSVPFEDCSDENTQSNMDKDYKAAVAQCENKLNRVRLLLETKPVPTPKFRPRRPRKVFVEPGSVEESFEDAFTPEDFVSLSNDSYIEYYSPYQYQNQELLETASPKMKTQTAPVQESAEIVKTLPDMIEKCDINSKVVSDISKTNNKNSNVTETKELKEKPPDLNETIPKKEIVTSCEDKLAKLKALLQERRRNNAKVITSPDSEKEPAQKSDEKLKPTKTVPIQRPKDKRYKNPCRTTDKRKKSKLRKNIQEDMLFAHELNSEDLSSIENSPSTKSLTATSPVVTNINRLSDSNIGNSIPDMEYFDEVSGRFHSSSTTDSEDSFQIVFNDSPKTTRIRRPSDCDSEDSFIVFEDSPDSCYTSNDVFGDETESDTDYSDTDSELSDSGCIPETKLSHNLSRTVGDLTDDSLYEDEPLDEVDCAVRTVCEEIPAADIEDVCDKVSEHNKEVEVKSTGLLLSEEKKILRKDLPPKKVRFSINPPKVHVMRVWSFAARQARIGDWTRYALDRDRFKRRIADVDMAVSWVLKPQHRSRVMFQRFMPWWNKQKRLELAEKKAKAEEERLKKEEDERIKEEEVKEAENGEANTGEEITETKEDNGNVTTVAKDLVCKELNIEITETKKEDIANVTVAKNSIVCKDINVDSREQKQEIMINDNKEGVIKANGIIND